MRLKNKDNDFEINFYEGILKKRPNFIEALKVLGDLYTKKGYYKKGLKIDKRLVKLCPNDPIVHYNLACSYSLVGDIDSSLKHIKKSIKLGYRDFDYMLKDPDLKNLHKDSRFQKLFLRLRKENTLLKDTHS